LLGHINIQNFIFIIEDDILIRKQTTQLASWCNLSCFRLLL